MRRPGILAAGRGSRIGRGSIAVVAILCILGVAATLATTGPAALPGAPGARLRFNLSPSLPLGVYLLEPARPAPGGRSGGRPLPGDQSGGRPVAGDLVLTCPPPWFARLARARGYLPAGECPGGSQPLGKMVLAAGGDRLDVEPAGLTVDGVRLPATASLAADHLGRPLPHVPPGLRRVAAGDLWLVAPHPRSLDSRYFGPVAAAQVLGRLRPLLTTGSPLRAALAALAAAIRRAHAHAVPRASPPRGSPPRGSLGPPRRPAGDRRP